MTTIWSDTGPVTLDNDANPNNDLRYGSEMLPAAPSWYGLHSSPWYSAADSATSRLTPVSYANIFGCQPLVFATIMRLLSWSVKVPLKTYERTGDDSRRRLFPRDHKLAASLASPWPRAGQIQLTMAMLGPLLVHGNGITSFDSGAGGQIEFTPRDWRKAMPILRAKDRIGGWDYDDGETDETIPVQQMLHAAWWSPLAPVGVSPLHALGVTLEIENMARLYARDSLKNMARPPSAVTVSNDFLDFDPEARRAALELVRQQIEGRHSGSAAGSVAILPSGLDWKQVGHTAVEAELIEQRRVDRDEINSVYQMPPPMVGDLTHATYSNVNALQDIAYTDSLGPPMILIESAINSQLVQAALGENGIFVEFDFAGVLRGNKLEEIQALREAIGTGLYTLNEGRSVLNYPRVDDEAANQLFIPSNNLTPLSAVDVTRAGGGGNE
jgi:HK97 family phage portal protein